MSRLHHFKVSFYILLWACCVCDVYIFISFVPGQRFASRNQPAIFQSCVLFFLLSWCSSSTLLTTNSVVYCIWKRKYQTLCDIHKKSYTRAPINEHTYRYWNCECRTVTAAATSPHSHLHRHTNTVREWFFFFSSSDRKIENKKTNENLTIYIEKRAVTLALN